MASGNTFSPSSSRPRKSERRITRGSQTMALRGWLFFTAGAVGVDGSQMVEVFLKTPPSEWPRGYERIQEIVVLYDWA